MSLKSEQELKAVLQEKQEEVQDHKIALAEAKLALKEAKASEKEEEIEKAQQAVSQAELALSEAEKERNKAKFEVYKNVPFTVASGDKRLWSTVFDVILHFIVVIILFWAFGGFKNEISRNEQFSSSFIMMGYLAVYYIVIAYVTHGRTLGKYLLGMKIIDLSNKRVSYQQLVQRNIIFLAFAFYPIFIMDVFLFVFWIVSSILIFNHPLCQSFNDRYAHTVVIDIEATKKRNKLRNQD